MGTLTKAYLEILEPFSLGGRSSGGQVRDRLDFQFNPKEYKVGKSATWKRDNQRGARKTGIPEFTGADPRKLSVEIFLDASGAEEREVATQAELLLECCTPTGRSRDDERPKPPFVRFGWGAAPPFTAFVSQVNVTYLMFQPDGTPTRAVCQLELEEIPEPDRRQNPTSGGRRSRRLHTLGEGETLMAIAYREYGDPTRWREIARHNGIDDPLRLRRGQTLLLPAGSIADGGS